MHKTEAQLTPVEAAVEKVLLEDFYLEVGQVMSETTCHELRCRVQHREPGSSDRLATLEAVEKLVFDGRIQIVEMFGCRCFKRLS